MSFADFTISIFSALSTVSWVPTLNPIFEGAWEAALAETMISVSSEMRRSLTARSVT